jgi:hypothetical protein
MHPQRRICPMHFLSVFFWGLHGLEVVFIALALVGKDIVFRFIIEYSSLSDFGPKVIIGLFIFI